MSACVSSDFCFETASTMDLVCWATASVMILASVASLDSCSGLLEVAAFSSLDQLPITRFGSACRKMVFCGVLLCFTVFCIFVPCSEALDAKL